MKSKLQTKEKGFTIIEVLIVLAIAGLILLIVFLAVPALQRNSRNTQRKNDVSNVLAAFSEYVSNRNGKVPPVYDATDGEFQNAAGDADGSGTDVKLGFYQNTDITYASGNTAITTPAVGTLYINSGAKCNAAGNNFGGTGASSRNVAVIYTIENQGGNQIICQEG